MPGRMAERIARAMFSGTVRLKRRVTRNPRLERLFYDAVNRDEFGNLAVHDAMLADEVRIRAYAQGIATNVKEGDVVLDLGTGVGILACLATRRRPRKVYAIDHSAVDLARTLAEANGLGGIDFRSIHSDNFDPDEAVDVIVQEQIGKAIFNERMVTSVAALRDRVLRPGGRILPNRFDVYVEPAELREDRVMPLIWEHRVEGLDFSALRAVAREIPSYPPPQSAVAAAFKRLLCEPEPVFSIDLERHGPANLPARVGSRRPATSAGVQHGLVVYFVAHFDAVNRFTNAPLAPPTNWPPVLLRTEARERRVGEMIDLELTADPLERVETWRWKTEAPRD
ncbi:MAG: arginine N-methyltransferase 1 [Solirubrobacterales bacterium]|nr:arginine N-methyltransferase 1 [Solirubrobacterales bacterium]